MYLIINNIIKISGLSIYNSSITNANGCYYIIGGSSITLQYATCLQVSMPSK
jgi:hypothetical protein